MSTCQRAFIALTRKTKRNLTLFVIVSIIFSTFFATSLINSTVSNLKKDIVEKISYSFSLTHEEGIFSQEEADKILNLKEIKTSNYEYSALAELDKRLKPVENQNIKTTISSHDVGIIGVNETQLYSLFENKTLTLTKGNHLTRNHENGVLIHEHFAKQNQLDVNHKFTVERNGKTLELTVAGIFSGDDYKKEKKPKEMIENNLVTSIDTLRKLDDTSEKRISKATYYVKSQNALDTALEAAKKLYPANDTFHIANRSQSNTDVITSLELMQNIVNNFLIGMTFVGIFILSFVLIFSVRSRINEIGILLSVGISKGKIVLQFLLEFLSLGILSWLFALLCSTVLSNQMTKMILNIFSQLEDSLNSDLFINQTLSINDLLTTGLIGFSVIIISILIATLPIMIKKPKEILYKIS